MSANEISVFFYGLFMDESLLADKGARASESTIGYVDGYRLCIGERATLVREPGARAYGVLMSMAPDAVDTLYSEPSVADYAAETIVVTVVGGEQVPAACYNLPADRLGLPEDYVDQIRRFA